MAQTNFRAQDMVGAPKAAPAPAPKKAAYKKPEPAPEPVVVFDNPVVVEEEVSE